MIRYADEFIILCQSQEQAQQALQGVRQWVEQAGLTLHPTKTRIVDANQAWGFDFLAACRTYPQKIFHNFLKMGGAAEVQYGNYGPALREHRP